MSKMADRPSVVKMAVTSDNQDLKDSMSREEIDLRTNINSTKTNADNAPKKKGAFKITSVKLNDTNDGDSMDDLDESHTEMTEDYSSEMLDTSRATDYGQETPSTTEEIPLTSQAIRMVNHTDTKEKTGTDMHSRFRVVKIETKEPFHRARWVCQDYLDPIPPVNTDKSDTKVYDDANSGSSSAGSSIHYIHGVDDPAKNPLLAGATGTVYSNQMQVPEGQSQSGQVSGTQDSFQPIHPAPNTAVNPSTMPSNPHSQVNSLGYYSDSSQGQGQQAQNPILCQTLNQSHSQQSINTIASTDNVQSNGQPSATGQASQGDIHSGQIQHNSQIIGTQTDNSNVQQQAGVFMPHYSSGKQGSGQTMPGTSMSMQSVYPPNIQSTSHNGMVSDTTTPAQPAPSSNQGNQGPPTSTYQTYVHLGRQQVANPGAPHTGQTDKKSGVVTHSDLQNLMIHEPDNSERTNRPDTDPLKGALAAAVGGELVTPQEEDQSGSSTVAIDNKIEQAMDLVKSHLMFAVREEVEVLKEQIAELIERNNQLEYENSILKASASPETLAKLAQPRQQPPSSTS